MSRENYRENPHEPLAQKGHENLAAACPAGKPFGWEAFMRIFLPQGRKMFAGGVGSSSKNIFSGKLQAMG